MAETTKIEWCDSTFNPWRGCTPVSVGPEGGCEHCYAAALSKRTGGPEYKSGAPRWRTSAENWMLPRRWNAQPFVECIACGWRGEHRNATFGGTTCPQCSPTSETLTPARRRVFCASMGDVFDNEVDPLWRADLFALIVATPNLDWLLLTKRIGNAAAMIKEARGQDPATSGKPWPFPQTPRGPLANVWLGATVVTQAEADRDIPKLLATPAAMRFLSMEPLLGPVDLERPRPGPDLDQGGGRMICQPWLIQSGIDWVIVGGESGHGARSMVLGWAKDIVRQCQSAGVPVMVKQLGAKPTNREGVLHRITDKKGGDITEWPTELRIRKFPQSTSAAKD